MLSSFHRLLRRAPRAKRSMVSCDSFHYIRSRTGISKSLDPQCQCASLAIALDKPLIEFKIILISVNLAEGKKRGNVHHYYCWWGFAQVNHSNAIKYIILLKQSLLQNDVDVGGEYLVSDRTNILYKRISYFRLFSASTSPSDLTTTFCYLLALELMKSELPVLDLTIS